MHQPGKVGFFRILSVKLCQALCLMGNVQRMGIPFFRKACLQERPVFIKLIQAITSNNALTAAHTVQSVQHYILYYVFRQIARKFSAKLNFVTDL